MSCHRFLGRCLGFLVLLSHTTGLGKAQSDNSTTSATSSQAYFANDTSMTTALSGVATEITPTSSPSLTAASPGLSETSADSISTLMTEATTFTSSPVAIESSASNIQATSDVSRDGVTMNSFQSHTTVSDSSTYSLEPTVLASAPKFS
ncbi:uncharacterized protein LOC106169988 [Lingula anatina]|uniref:Uncharacterized protein LOC106169988 n=1 Tax=Lingula anatina TaxID=7574 RepID=A0A1S3J428_LINAN|nr:uncharacterized protein LOC106169988 [Lingula anatina]|eukprot:XP_013405135.1 uncharacterized protein LOC106169988 [Lingula anatina]